MGYKKATVLSRQRDDAGARARTDADARTGGSIMLQLGAESDEIVHWYYASEPSEETVR
jgi:hypothetical protein